MKNIATALVKAQSEMVTPKKGNVNPFFKNKYADINSILEAVMPAFHNNGISILQPTVHIDGKNFVKTILLHDSGEYLEGFTEIIYNKNNDAQAQGSGITYARRYGLQSFVNVGADDDDGQKAVAQPKPKSPDEQQRQRVILHIEKSTTVDELDRCLPAIPDNDFDLILMYDEKKHLLKSKK